MKFGLAIQQNLFEVLQMKNRLIKNASTSVVQFLVNAVILFIFYRFLLSTIGAADIGIWSLVLGISSLSQVAAFGFAGGAVKYVAQYLARQQEDKVSKVIQTSLLSVGILVGVFLLLGFPFFKMFILNAAGTENAFKVEQILPLGMVCLWLMVLVSVVFSSLDGYQRIDLRNYIFMGSSALNLGLCFFVVPRFHLLGLAYLNLIQNCLLVISGWLLLRRLNRHLPVVPLYWDYRILREVISYNVKFQLISFTTMLCEPTTKYFLGIFGGMASVGFFEMAIRLARQIRGVFVSANQAVVPVIANLIEQDAEKVRRMYIDSFQLLLFTTLPVYSVLILAAPVISRVWLGSFNEFFIFSLWTLFLAHIFNLLSNPAYFVNMGTGNLTDNLIAHVGMASCNLLLAYVLGLHWGGRGVVVAWALALFVGSLCILISYNRNHHISTNDILPWPFIRLVVFVLGLFFLGEIGLLLSNGFNAIATNLLVASAVTAGIFYQQIRHPFYTKLRGWLNQKGVKA